MSAETSDQLICRGVGQNVSPRERTDISSVDKEQLERLMTEEWSSWMLTGLVLRRERLRVTVELEALSVTLDGMSLSLALGLLTCWLRLLSVKLWSIIPRKRQLSNRRFYNRSSHLIHNRFIEDVWRSIKISLILDAYLKPGSHLWDTRNTSEISISASTRWKEHVSFSCAYFTCVILISQVWTRLKASLLLVMRFSCTQSTLHK